jgi:hypothetical protein
VSSCCVRFHRGESGMLAESRITGTPACSFARHRATSSAS